ncbi:MAG TPA: hypothetical protein VFO19_05395 [Vicinamibacterales bacterium]|nr:hypothetical protein [Vicinamibacterales bacterium]
MVEVPDVSVSRALEQIEAIHEQLAKGEVYRGWRPVPVAVSGVLGLIAAAWQSIATRPVEPWSFTAYWLGVALFSLIVGCAEIVWHYVARATATDRRRTQQVLGQFLPALVAGAIMTGALVRLSAALATLLPGLWALFFGVGIFAARPYLPGASVWVALYYWTAGLVLLWIAGGVDTLSPWAVGGTFGMGQLLAALALYISDDRTSDKS